MSDKLTFTVYIQRQEIIDSGTGYTADIVSIVNQTVAIVSLIHREEAVTLER